MIDTLNELSTLVDRHIEHIDGEGPNPLNGHKVNSLDNLAYEAVGLFSRPLQIDWVFEKLGGRAYVSFKEYNRVRENFEDIDAILDFEKITNKQREEIVERLNEIEKTGYFSFNITHNPRARIALYDRKHYPNYPSYEEMVEVAKFGDFEIGTHESHNPDSVKTPIDQSELQTTNPGISQQKAYASYQAALAERHASQQAARAALEKAKENTSTTTNNGDTGSSNQASSGGSGGFFSDIANAVSRGVERVVNAVKEVANAVRDLFSAKPIILDLDGDGVEVAFGQQTFFDLDNDGFREQTSWVSADDGFLVIDLTADGEVVGTGDGQINQVKELAFSNWGAPGKTDLQALAEAVDENNNRIFDTNGDLVLDAQDDVWAALKIWQDLDQDGVSDEGELKTLSEWGIISIDLTYADGSEYTDHDDNISVFGNTLFGSANYNKSDGSTGQVGDVALNYSRHGKRFNESTGLMEFETSDRLDAALKGYTEIIPDIRAASRYYADDSQKVTEIHQSWDREQVLALRAEYVQHYQNLNHGDLQGQALEYTASYADLISAFGSDSLSALEHMGTAGANEGRSITFDGLEYIASHGDLMDAFGANANAGAIHYIQTGVQEGRGITFDSLEYLSSHGDLAQAFGVDKDQGSTHYIQTGRHEGREISFNALEFIASHDFLIYSFGSIKDMGSMYYIMAGRHIGLETTFNSLEYIASHSDLADAFGANIDAGAQHYIEAGFWERRKVSFDSLEYIASHSDLADAFGTNIDAGAEHYIIAGRHEGRKTTFDSLQYIASHDDLIDAFQFNQDAGAKHFIETGRFEGRVSDFDALQYIASYSDLIQEFGLNANLATKHWITTGHGEGRQVDFNPEQYLANYSDLKAIYEDDYDAATLHFITSGFFEGRHDDVVL